MHVIRQIKNYLSSIPKLEQAQQLLSISRHITQIKTVEQAQYCLIDFHNWHQKHRSFLEAKSFYEQSG